MATTMNSEAKKMCNKAYECTFDELERNTSETKVTDNEAFKDERAKRIRRHVHYSYDDSNRTVTVEMYDGYDNLLGKETFTEEDMKTLAQEKGEKIINRKLAKERSEARSKTLKDGLSFYTQFIGSYMIGYAAGYVVVKLIKKVLKK